ncbi:MAG: 3-hydroxyacyl-CoA dehydrogenase family protein [Halanaerobiales bacterium]|nr:3-hydroxyacyl-CoA dehydrogenase family protein [Halanaerobiales bacterium]
MSIVGVIGAGVMGAGVTQSVAQAGHEVILLDLSEEVLQKACDEIKKNMRFQAFFNKSSKGVSFEDVMQKIKLTTDYDLLKRADVIIENVPEIWLTKKEVYQKLNDVCQETCIYLVNTSCISITKVAALMDDPSKVIGVHFMNPVPLKNTVEAIKGYHTSEETIQQTNDFLSSIGKEAVLVNDLPGFVSNRISHLLMNEAAFVVQDQVAEPKDVDKIFRECFGHKMGPLQTADLIGLDTVVNSLDILYESYQDPKFKVCPLLRKMTEAGLNGRKSGQGFYTYDEYNI